MALDMRALYYIALAALSPYDNAQDEEKARAIENCLNQNFMLLAQQLALLDARLDALEHELSL